MATLLIAGSISFPQPALADDNAELERLRAQLKELEMQVKALERQPEARAGDAAAGARETPVANTDEQGFVIRSADGRSELRLRGQTQVDGRVYPGGTGSANATTASDAFLLKQFRPTLQGALWSTYDFLLMPDFGNGRTVIQDAYVDARVRPWLQLKAGKQKTPFGIERLQGESDGKFIERALPNDLVPNRDIGVQIHGMLADGRVDYALGYFNGVVDGNSSDNYASADAGSNGGRDIAARVFATPFRYGPDVLQNLGLGLAVTYGNAQGVAAGGANAATLTQSNLPSFRSALGQLTFFSYRTAAASGGSPGSGSAYADGERLRWSPQFYYYNGPFGLLGEYVRVSQQVARPIAANAIRSDRVDNDAWQITASWLLTGESAGYANPAPKQNFEPEKGGGPGAWELALRYSELRIDNAAFAAFGPGSSTARQARSYADPTVSARKAQAWTSGINWYPNRNLKLALDYEHTRFDGGWTNASGAVLDRPPEDVVSTRLQLAF
ncbi:phosphate-selective porin O and P [mine drainage metagenome]|uniref:Phosphate-selective porin O and P n=1 Tax=mine drainage metagenome TaxID=410659 RepID=A0A1J5QD68_9ZZZZ